MRKSIYSVATILLVLLFTSCEKNDKTELVGSEFKNIEISCGESLEIPVLASTWKIESVKDLTSGNVMLDKDLNPICLEEQGTVEALNGWLILKRSKEDAFTICLKENFNSDSRSFVVCINENSNKDYVTVMQNKGRYEFLKSDIREIDDRREIYTSNEKCLPLTLTNNTAKPVFKPCDYIFKNIVYSSQFESDDFGAFDWVADESMELSMPDLIIDHKIYWDNSCLYKSGVTTKPFIANADGGNSLLVEPNQTLYISGEITYCKRVCDYTFTIENEVSGTHFDIHGVWTQIVPISSNTILRDKP